MSVCGLNLLPSDRRAGPAADAGTGEVVTVMFLAGVVLTFVMLLTLAGRGAEASTRIDHAAEASAQAAALARDPRAAVVAATQTVMVSLDGLCVGGPRTDVDTSGWRPGGLVAVTIACTLRTGDLAPLPLPGTVTARGSSAAVIDTYRYADVEP